MLGRGLTWATSSRSPGFRSHRVFRAEVRDSLSNVSSNLSTDNGLPAVFGRALFVELGVKALSRPALEIAGEVDISSSRSGEGEAFQFLEGPAEDTWSGGQNAGKTRDQSSQPHLIDSGRGESVHGNEEGRAAWPGYSS